jgi:hypothetical protein
LAQDLAHFVVESVVMDCKKVCHKFPLSLLHRKLIHLGVGLQPPDLGRKLLENPPPVRHIMELVFYGGITVTIF